MSRTLASLNERNDGLSEALGDRAIVVLHHDADQRFGAALAHHGAATRLGHKSKVQGR